MVVFDYSELQMMIKTITGSDDSQLNKDKVQKVIVSTYENSKNCEEIFSVISERFSSKRSTINNILKVSQAKMKYKSRLFMFETDT